MLDDAPATIEGDIVGDVVQCGGDTARPVSCSVLSVSRSVLMQISF